MYRRLGWLVIAVVATAAHAAPPASHSPPTAKAAPVAAPRATHRSTRPEPRRLAAVARPADAAALDVDALPSLTGDREIGNADRVDGDEVKGMVAFTFDDGPDPETTPAVIDALEKYDVPATFFVVTDRVAGKHGAKSREILRRELDAGFLVGSHTVTHRSLKRATGDKLTREVDASIRALSAQTGRPIGIFRPPYGSLSAAGRARLKKLRLTEVRWSVDTLDWKAHNPDQLRKKVISMIKKDGGGVVLMHDVKPITAQIIGDVLDDLEAENCARLADHKEPIVPVSLHYFLRDGKSARAVPRAVQQRTSAYKAALPDRCARRHVSAIADGKSSGTRQR